MKHQKSFTLIELLVVIAIIGLLSSIVVVNVNSAREKAKKARALQFSQSLYNALGAEAVGYWTFDENVQDFSGNGNIGAWSGASSYDTADKILGSAAGSFTGLNYVDCGAAASLNLSNKDFTIEGWFKRNGSGTETGQLISKFGAGNIGNYEIYWTDCGNSTLGSRWTCSGAWRTICFAPAGAPSGSNPTAAGVWYHFALVHAGTKMYTYLNGEFMRSGDVGGTIDSVSNSLQIGQRNGGSQRFSGLIDEIRIYAQALTSAEIQKHYVEGLLKHLAAK